MIKFIVYLNKINIYHNKINIAKILDGRNIK